MAHSPPISPVVATPLAHRKRRHSKIDNSVIDLTADNEPSSPVAKTKATNGDTNGNNSKSSIVRNLEDDDDLDESDKKLFEDILDTAELEPYMAGQYSIQEDERNIFADRVQVSSRARMA